MNRTRIAMPVEVQVASTADEVPRVRDIHHWADVALEEVADEGEPPDVCVRVVDEAESRALNLRFRGIDKPTNVLSFPAEVELPEGSVLGDVVICAPVVSEEAADQGKTVSDHYAHMVVHGVLHLVGYDHERHEEAERMEALEIRILDRIGVPDPYAAV